MVCVLQIKMLVGIEATLKNKFQQSRERIVQDMISASHPYGSLTVLTLQRQLEL